MYNKIYRYINISKSILGKEFFHSILKPKNRVLDLKKSLNAAIEWICNAQDATPDYGVARSYSITYNNYFKKKGWIASYPETTGYIIPTMFKASEITKKLDLEKRAIKMAEWETQVQLKNGAVQGGTIDQKATPAVFNTGQVIFGWVEAYMKTNKEKFIISAINAGDFLTKYQNPDGTWKDNIISDYASKNIKYSLYNSRTAWALLKLYEVTKNTEYKNAAINNIEFVLKNQNNNGWYKYNCLNDQNNPLLHTIAYCTRGILESGLILENAHYIKCAKLTADNVLKRQKENGFISGRLNSQWHGAVSWSCLTGNAQMAIIWGRLFELFHEKKYLESLKRTNRYLMMNQFLNKKYKNLYGGISGSYPIYGSYGKFQILNWAVKFFIDSIIKEIEIDIGC